MQYRFGAVCIIIIVVAAAAAAAASFYLFISHGRSNNVVGALVVRHHSSSYVAMQDILILGKKFNTSNWKTVTEKLRCITDTGSWKMGKERPSYISENKTIPCFDTPYSTTKGATNCSKTALLESNKLQWVAESCGYPFLRFPFHHMCQKKNLMDRIGNMLVVGDSVTEEFVVTMMNTAYQGATASCPVCWHKCNHVYELPCAASAGSKIRPKLLSFRNDRVTIRDTLVEDLANNFFDRPWIHLLKEHKVSLLVLNRGAHYEDDDKVLAGLNETFTYLRTHHRDVTVVFRNTPHGHMNFTDYFESSVPLEKNMSEVLGIGKSEWHYSDFARQNEKIRDLMAEHYPGMIYLDVASMLNLRADSHSDFLHYCIPGPVDEAVNLIFNVLFYIINLYSATD